MVMQLEGYGNIPADHLDATFAALADPTRRAILARLASGEASGGSHCLTGALPGVLGGLLPAAGQPPRRTEGSRSQAQTQRKQGGGTMKHVGKLVITTPSDRERLLPTLTEA